MRDEKGDNRKGLTRRGFLKRFGAGAVIATGAPTTADRVFGAPSPGKMPKKWSQEADVVVVGFGAAGAAAALEAEKAGAKVIILEKMAKEGGTTRLSHGVVLGAGTSVQKAAGIADSPEDLYRFLMAVGKGYVDSNLVKLYASESGKNIEWLIGMGLEFPLLYVSGVENVPKYAAVTPPKPRGHVAKGGGAQFFSILREAVEEKGIKVLRETPAFELVTNSTGEVVGVKAQSKGEELAIRSRKAVVLTSSGFGRNKEMLRAYSPLGYEGVSETALGSTGDGHRMAQALGADLTGVFAIAGLPSAVEKPSVLSVYSAAISPFQKIEAAAGKPSTAVYALATQLTAASPCVAINKGGKRFTNETMGYGIVNIKVFQQEDSFVWTVFDEKARRGRNIISPNFSEEGLLWSYHLVEEVEKGIVLRGETFGALAENMKVDRQTFEITMNEYNRNANMGKDPEFGKTYNLEPLENPPFYAIKTKPGVIDSCGGLRIDTKARVLNVFGKNIHRLYAVGPGLTGGFVGEIYPASGISLGLCITFGRIAGRNAAKEASV